MQNSQGGRGPVTPSSIVGQQGGRGPGPDPGPPQPQGADTGVPSGYYSTSNPFSAAPTSGDGLAESDMRQDRYQRQKFAYGTDGLDAVVANAQQLQ